MGSRRPEASADEYADSYRAGSQLDVDEHDDNDEHDDDEHDDASAPEILVVQLYARSLGCDYVLFDADADVDEALPTWDW